jgi:hypothetical protein
VGLKEVRRQAIEDHPNATEEALNEVHMAVPLKAVLAGLIEIPLDLADLILLMTAALMAAGLILLMAAALMAVLTGGKVLIEVPLGLADLLARANCSCRLVLKTFNRLLVDVLQFVIV